VVPVGIAALWVAIDRIAWLGPWLADAGRAVLGTEAVSRIEDGVYGLKDTWNRWWRRGEKPEAHWTVPATLSSAPGPPSVADEADAADPGRAPFRPLDIGPLFATVAAAGDGVWVPVADPARPAADTVLYKTLIHPDRERSWAELYVVAMDLRRLRVLAAPGTLEPEASTPEGRRYARRGVVPVEHRESLVAVFNGGFKAEHGHYGMRVDGVTLLPPRDRACTFAAYDDDTMRIATWTALADGAERMTWWRQTPSCMVENGKLHPGLAREEATSWGTAVGGETVIRRSAIGIDPERRILYVGVSNATTARAIAIGMQHAGASDVAQLDINWSYPRFVLFRRSESGERQGHTLFEGFAYEDNEYVSRSSTRDFFYVVSR
jgi:hypothetical protein